MSSSTKQLGRLKNGSRLGNCANSPAAWFEENRLRSGLGHRCGSDALDRFWPSSPGNRSNLGTHSGVSRFAAAFWQGLVHHGFGKLGSVLRSAAQELGTRAIVQRNRQEHIVSSRIQSILEPTASASKHYFGRRLSEAQLLELVYHALNPAERQVPKVQDASALLTNTDWLKECGSSTRCNSEGCRNASNCRKPHLLRCSDL